MVKKAQDSVEFSIPIAIGLKWFEVHADQRMRSIRFFLFTLSFCVVGFVTLWSTGQWIFGIVIGLLLSTITECFRRLDKRTSQLVKVSEQLIQECSRKLNSETSMKLLDVVEESNKKENTNSYTEIFDMLFIASHIVAYLIVILSLMKLAT